MCYRFLIAAPFRDGGLEEGAGGRPLHRKGGATEQQEEGPQAILVARPQHIGHVDLEEAARPRTGAPVVQPPHAAVGKDSKPDASLRSDIGARQIAQHLPVRRAAAKPVGAIALIKGEPEAFALLHDQGVLKAVVGIAATSGACLGCHVGEQQMVGNVLVAGGSLLRQVVGPTQQLQHRTNEILLGHRLIGLMQRIEALVCSAEFTAEVGELQRRRFPFRSRADAVGEKELTE